MSAIRPDCSQATKVRAISILFLDDAVDGDNKDEKHVSMTLANVLLHPPALSTDV